MPETQVSAKLPARIRDRRASLHDPAKFSVVPSQAILHLEQALCLPGRAIRSQVVLAVCGMHAGDPAIAFLLLEGASGKCQSRLVDVDALSERIVEPHHDRKLVEQGTIDLQPRGIERFFELWS